MSVGGPVESERLTMIRDLIAALRAFEKDDFAAVDEVLAPYKTDREKGLALVKVLIDVASSSLSTAADFGLAPKKLLNFYLKQIPEDLRPSFQRAADLILAVHEGGVLARQNIHFRTSDELGEFIRALMNLETWVTRQTAKKVGSTSDEIYDLVAKGLAAQP